MSAILKWGAILLACVVPLGGVAVVYLHEPTPDKLNEAIMDIGFYPITPPNLARSGINLSGLTRRQILYHAL
jgi:hypothetical protein